MTHHQRPREFRDLDGRQLREALSTRRGELDQIQFLLEHVSSQTTERYLGCKHKVARRSQRQNGDRARRCPNRCRGYCKPTPSARRISRKCFRSSDQSLQFRQRAIYDFQHFNVEVPICVGADKHRIKSASVQRRWNRYGLCKIGIPSSTASQSAALTVFTP